MKHLLLLALLFSGISSFAQQNLYAVQLCAERDKETFPAWCAQQDIEFVTYLNNQFAVVRTKDVNAGKLSAFCFSTPVRVADQNLTFNTNTILVQLKPGMEQTFVLTFSNTLQLNKHPFIPDYYTVISKGKSNEDVELDLVNIRKNNAVVYAGINQVFTIQASTNDTYYNRQWSIENTGSAIQGNGTPNADMNVDSAWQYNWGTYIPKVAILDSGVDTLHEDLVDNMLTGFDALADSAGNTQGAPTPNFSMDGHGTSCAGIVGAIADNGKGIAGIAPMSKLIPIRIFNYKNYGGSIGVQATTSTEALVNGSAWAWRVADSDIMSTSAGLSDIYVAVLNIDKTLVDAEINAAFLQARGGKGIAMFFSAGNDDVATVLWPASIANTIAVGASNMCDKRKALSDCSGEAWGSSYGLTLDVVAPGVRISTTDITGAKGFTTSAYTQTFNGTSAACPNAAGVGALLLTINPALHARDIKAILNKTADKVSGYTYDTITPYGTWNLEMGHGRVNAFEAIKMAETYHSSVSVKEDVSDKPFSIYPNPSSGTVTLSNTSEEKQVFQISNTLGQSIAVIELERDSRQIIALTSGVYLVKSNRYGVQRLIVK
jgi:subtilisin family serine protease